jgi:hypothetical protein
MVVWLRRRNSIRPFATTLRQLVLHLASETGGQDYRRTVIPSKSDRGENAYGLRYSRTACTLVILTADYNNAAVFSIIALQHDSLVGNTVLIT